MSVPHSPAELQKLYQKRFAGASEYRNNVWRVLIDDYLAEWIPPHATVLDLGCGHCEFINNIPSETRLGMDLNPDAVRKPRRECGFWSRIVRNHGPFPTIHWILYSPVISSSTCPRRGTFVIL